MEVNLSNSTLACCSGAIMAHLQSLKSMLAHASTIEFRSLCEDEIEEYTAALAEINNQFKIYNYE